MNTETQELATSSKATFQDFDFNDKILAAIKEQGYTTPTEIQQQAMPLIAQGCDLVGLAQTGTGKTAAFLLPILQKLLDSEPGDSRALILVPTRELAFQIREVLENFTRKTNIKSCCLIGGVPISRQIRRMKRGIDMVVACPGRLLDHVQRRTLDLRTFDTFVLDEADQMFDMGFLPSIKRIVELLPQERQTLLFSATMPKAIRSLADNILTDPKTVSIKSNTHPPSIRQGACYVPEHLKSKLLCHVVGDMDQESSVLVFTRTKRRAKSVSDELQKSGYAATSIQGNLSQSKRKAAMEGFRSGAVRILVATDIVARGLDVPSVSHVINYDVPDTVESYTHRIGRTGRASRSGKALTLFTSRNSGLLRAIEKLRGDKLELEQFEGFDSRVANDAPRDKPRRRRFGGNSSFKFRRGGGGGRGGNRRQRRSANA